MSDTIKVLLLDAIKGTGYHVKEIRDELEVYHKLLDCDRIDIVSRLVGGSYYSIVVDDDGLWRDGVTISAVSPEDTPVLVGNLVFTNSNKNTGELTSLTDVDIRRIKANSKILVQQLGTKMKPIIAVQLDDA